MPHSKSRNTVLIIENDSEILDSLSQLLQYEGFKVTSSKNGRVALDILAKDLFPDLIILDLMMPVMNGWEFLTVKNSDLKISSIPVIVTSAIDDPGKLGKSTTFVKKPIDFDSLLKIVRKYCNISSI